MRYDEGRFVVIVLPVDVDSADELCFLKKRFFVGTIRNDGEVEPMEECRDRDAAHALCRWWNRREEESFV